MFFLFLFDAKGKGMEPVSKGFEDCFNTLSDPRIARRKLYPLKEILFVVLCGSICGAESWRDFVLFGNEKLDFLKTHFAFSNGIASKNTFARVFAVLDPVVFRECFMAWVKSLQTQWDEEVIAIDGKTLCNSGDEREGTPAIHLVSAFAAKARLVLGQQKVDEKSNEITAIPALLALLDVKGQIVTIDAMGCQRAIAQQIQDQGADYVLALKGNQETLNDEVRLFLETEVAKPASDALGVVYEDVDAGHGRIETRRCIVSSHIDWLEQKPQWAGLKTIAMIEETRDVGDKVSIDRRFFISSLPADAQKVAQAVRAHWSVENALHWTLDVVFNEDESRVRKGHAPHNMALVRHFALNMLNTVKKGFKDVSVKALRKKAGWGNAFLQLVLKQNF
jgi:predicted transposase YbfD/YdcC